MSTYGKHLRNLRRRAGLRLVDIAKPLRVSPQYLSNVESGRTDVSLHRYYRIVATMERLVYRQVKAFKKSGVR